MTATTTVLVTGAGSGIGQAVALRFAAAGARVLCADHDLAAAEGTVASIVQAVQSVDVWVEHVDVASAASVADLYDRLVSRARVPDVVVNCAGVNPKMSFMDMAEADWDKVVDVNLKGTFLVSQGAAQRMDSGGAIVNIGSINAEQASATIVAYAASKGGVHSLTKAMAVALADRGIRVNAIAPGPCETNLTAPTRATQQGMERLLSRVLMGRLGQPEEIAEVAFFLASAQASFISGAVITVDGGVSATR